MPSLAALLGRLLVERDRRAHRRRGGVKPRRRRRRHVALVEFAAGRRPGLLHRRRGGAAARKGGAPRRGCQASWVSRRRAVMRPQAPSSPVPARASGRQRCHQPLQPTIRKRARPPEIGDDLRLAHGPLAARPPPSRLAARRRRRGGAARRRRGAAAALGVGGEGPRAAPEGARGRGAGADAEDGENSAGGRQGLRPGGARVARDRRARRGARGLASKIVPLLCGKHKPTWQPQRDVGDFVVVTNVADVIVTGPKMREEDVLPPHGLPGRLRVLSMEELIKKNPVEPLRKAVVGMLPKNKLRGQRLRRSASSRAPSTSTSRSCATPPPAPTSRRCPSATAPRRSAGTRRRKGTTEL